jgi:glucokinase
MPDVIIESDVRCAALAESREGHGRAATSCLYVTVGTGISHTMVIDGKPWSGRRGEAIAFGELSVSAEACLVDGAPLTVEGQASGLTLERVASDLGVSPLATGDTRLDAARRRAGQTIANALAGAVVLFDPAIVVLGGGFGVSAGAFGEAIDEHYAALTTTRPDAPTLVRSALGTRAGVIGAGLVVHERYGSTT